MVVAINITLSKNYTHQEIFLILDMLKYLVLEYPLNEFVINEIIDSNTIYPRIANTSYSRQILRDNIVAVTDAARPLMHRQIIKKHHTLYSFYQSKTDLFAYYFEEEERV